jgi:hypothetical protein
MKQRRYIQKKIQKVLSAPSGHYTIRTSLLFDLLQVATTAAATTRATMALIMVEETLVILIQYDWNVWSVRVQIFIND